MGQLYMTLQNRPMCRHTRFGHFYDLRLSTSFRSVYINAFQASADEMLYFSPKILEFHDRIWNHHEKYIERSTNMPIIGSQICEIAVRISEM